MMGQQVFPCCTQALNRVNPSKRAPLKRQNAREIPGASLNYTSVVRGLAADPCTAIACRPNGVESGLRAIQIAKRPGQNNLERHALARH